MSIEVIKPGLMTTLQDAGRPGYAHLGVGRSGAFDAPALRIANALCGNQSDACGVEITLLGPTLRFHDDALVAVTGAPLPLTIDGAAASMWAPLPVRTGATLTLGVMSSGCRSYLAVRGGIEVASVLGSRSTDVNVGIGPFAGRALRRGDRLVIGTTGSDHAAAIATRRWQLDPRPWFDADTDTPLRLLPGSHFEHLTGSSRKLLFSDMFIVQNQSNRVGVRLSGPALEFTHPIEMVSEGCIPGLLQLPPSGQPIAFGPECPVSGGYPRMGQIAAVDLPRLAQSRPGDALRFMPCTFDDALQALHDRERALKTLEIHVAARLAE